MIRMILYIFTVWQRKHPAVCQTDDEENKLQDYVDAINEFNFIYFYIPASIILRLVSKIHQQNYLPSIHIFFQ